ncbi:MAG: protein O-mannosyl-transferase TMTC1-related protein [Myxococcota bacterium]
MSGTARDLPPARGLLVCAALVAFGFALYGNSVGNGYAIDDQLIIEDNPLTSRGIAAIPEILTTNYLYQEDRGASYRAVPRVSYAIEYEVFGAAPHVHHFVNVLLFCIAGVLVWRWVALLFPEAPPALSVGTALLFLAHPIHTEVVNNLKSRDELMSFLFGASAVVACLRFAVMGGGRWLAAGTLAFLLALASKESAQHFLGVVPLAMYVRCGWQPRRLGLALAGLLLASLVYWGGIFLFLNREYTYWMATATQDFPFVEHPLLFVDDPATRYGTALYSLWVYLRLMVWPHPLSFFYGFGAIPLVDFASGWVWLSLGVHLGLGVYALGSLRSRSIPGFAVCYFLGTLFMFSNLVVPMSGIVAERFAFSASLGVCLLAAWGLTRLRGPWALGLGLALLGVFGALTIERNGDWESRRTLAERDVQSYPDAGIIRAVLFQLEYADATAAADPELRRRKWAAADAQLAEIERIYPPYGARAAYTRGQAALHLLDAPEQALSALRLALIRLETGPSGPHPDRGLDVPRFRIHLELARACQRLGRPADARRHLGDSVADWNRGAREPIDAAAVAAAPLDEAVAMLSVIMAEDG